MLSILQRTYKQPLHHHHLFCKEVLVKSRNISKSYFPARHYSTSTVQKNTLAFTIDRYKCATVDHTLLPVEPTSFAESLQRSLEHWRETQTKGVWLRISKNNTDLLPICFKYGFQLHHTRRDYIMVSNWLVEGEENRLPHFADHSIGCGGIVLNDKNEILLVTEAHTPHLWKIPGGLLNTGRRGDKYSCCTRSL
eukprot:TRINITY_DN6167_c0_g1_i1.p1 TRINITY_DN6167_c0_g1~~TRINITY_DN6167_c0_g1_i1.p1  ORF type:complete len:194 (-),score=21.94 TRINITY_DN6167_c0_g1_i1:423-1004(-)